MIFLASSTTTLQACLAGVTTPNKLQWLPAWRTKSILLSWALRWPGQGPGSPFSEADPSMSLAFPRTVHVLLLGCHCACHFLHALCCPTCTDVTSLGTLSILLCWGRASLPSSAVFPSHHRMEHVCLHIGLPQRL